MLALEDVGKEVVCPRCGRRGRVAVDVFKRGWRRYWYITVRHTLGHARARRCIIRPLTGEEAVSFALYRAVEPGRRLSMLRSRVEELEREVERLKKENERLRRENELMRARLRIWGLPTP